MFSQLAYNTSISFNIHHPPFTPYSLIRPCNNYLFKEAAKAKLVAKSKISKIVDYQFNIYLKVAKANVVPVHIYFKTNPDY